MGYDTPANFNKPFLAPNIKRILESLAHESVFLVPRLCVHAFNVHTDQEESFQKPYRRIQCRLFCPLFVNGHLAWTYLVLHFIRGISCDIDLRK